MSKSKTGKTYHAVRVGTPIKNIAVELAGDISNAELMVKSLRQSIGEAMIEAGIKIIRCGEVEAVNDLAHFYGEARMAEGIAAATIGKEQSNLRNIARACFGGVKCQKQLMEAAKNMKLHELAAYAKTITPKAYANPNAKQRTAGGGKSKVTDKEFSNMKRLTEFLTPAQATRIIQLCEKILAAKPAKVVKLKKAA